MGVLASSGRKVYLILPEGGSKKQKSGKIVIEKEVLRFDYFSVVEESKDYQAPQRQVTNDAT